MLVICKISGAPIFPIGSKDRKKKKILQVNSISSITVVNFTYDEVLHLFQEKYLVEMKP